MLGELMLVGGVIVAVIGVLEVAGRLDTEVRHERSAESVVRDAMRGSEAGAVRAEFRRSGISPPETRHAAGFR